MLKFFRVCFLVYVCLSGVVGPVFAGQSDAVVRIGGCSGVCVDPVGIVLTSRHCDLPSRVEVRFPNRTVHARQIYVCPDTEGPVVYDCDGEGFPFVPLARRAPRSGMKVWSLGYASQGGQRKLFRAEGELLRSGVFRYQGGAFVGNVANFQTAPGWSGGPLFNGAGEVCGLLSCGDCRTSVYISFKATKCAVENARWKPVTPDHRPLLLIFTSVHCGPCRDFRNDFENKAEFRSELQRRFRIQLIDIDREPQRAQSHGVTSVPAFLIAGREPRFGYDGATDLLAWLHGAATEEKPAIVSRPPVRIPPTDPSPTQQPQQPPPTQPQQPEESPTTDADEQKSPPPVIAQPSSPPPTPPSPPTPSESSAIAERVERLTSIVQTTLTITSWLGLTGATGGVGALIWGGVALWRRWRRRKRSETPGRGPPPAGPPPPSTEPPPPTPPVTVTVDTPPPPQAIVPETRFAPYERDTFAQAFAWAEVEIVRKYPGAVGTLESLRSLIDQYLAAKGHTKSADS